MTVINHQSSSPRLRLAVAIVAATAFTRSTNASTSADASTRSGASGGGGTAGWKDIKRRILEQERKDTVETKKKEELGPIASDRNRHRTPPVVHVQTPNIVSWLTPTSNPNNRDGIPRKLEDDTEAAPCDASLLACLPNISCLECFTTMSEEGIDWAGVSSEAPCADVLMMLHDQGHCQTLASDVEGRNYFCNAFNSCVTIDASGSDAIIGGDGMSFVHAGNTGTSSAMTREDCDNLKKCDWDGKMESFLGDGTCQRFGCYNTAVCDWDGGDCCEDTCESTTYTECGSDGYQCRDPSSPNCRHGLNPDCEEEQGEGVDVTDVSLVPVPPGGGNGDDADVHFSKCDGSDEMLYAIEQFDSWGDGWDMTKMALRKVEDGKEDAMALYEGGLKGGHSGWEYICLEKGCFGIDVGGGFWGNEVSWKIRRADGGPYLAFGGAPMTCTFPLGGNACENTCQGKERDESELEITECQRKKCVLHIELCKADDDCKPCLVNDPPSYCYTNNMFKAVVDCSICRCPDDHGDMEEMSELNEDDAGVEWDGYCNTKHREPSGEVPPTDPNSPFPEKAFEEWTPEGYKCSAEETLKGTTSIMTYVQCVEINGTDAITHNWNLNHFGNIDRFEACAMWYEADPINHHGHTAMDCMKKLVDIVHGETEIEDPEYVKSIATHLYYHPEEFCDCTASADKYCPGCVDFSRFKILLMESKDACDALDNIDCPAWEEFTRPCKESVQNEFGSLDWNHPDICDFVVSGCDQGAFPTFRRLDCGKEISKVAWDFYNDYSKNCLGDTPIEPTGGGGIINKHVKEELDEIAEEIHDAGQQHEDGKEEEDTDKVVDPKTNPAPHPTDIDHVGPAKQKKKDKTSSSYMPPESQKKSSSFFSTGGGGGMTKWIVAGCGLAAVGLVLFKRRRDARANGYDFVRYQRGPTSPSTSSDNDLGQELFSARSFGSYEQPPVPSPSNPV